MENASKALIIAGAILLSILLIAIGMLIYNSAQSTITESLTSFSSQEIEAANNQFTGYAGSQTGSNVNAMITRLIANAQTYKDEVTRIPAVQFTQVVATNTAGANASPSSNSDQQNYIDSLTSVKNRIENKHTYFVEFSYQTNGLIDYITVTYDAQNVTDHSNAHFNRK